MIFHIKTHRGTVRAFLINSIKIRFLVLKLRKTVSVLVRFALKRKISVKTVKLEHLNRGRVRAFKLKSRKTDKKVRYAVRKTVGYGTDTVDG